MNDVHVTNIFDIYVAGDPTPEVEDSNAPDAGDPVDAPKPPPKAPVAGDPVDAPKPPPKAPDAGDPVDAPKPAPKSAGLAPNRAGPEHSSGVESSSSSIVDENSADAFAVLYRLYVSWMS